MKPILGIIAAICLILSATPAPADPRSCVIRQFITAKNVTSFIPRGITSDFSSKDHWVFGLARLDCLKTKRGDAFLFRWFRDNREILKSRAGIGKSHNWRIWSRVRARPGKWKIQLTYTHGRVIAERTFVVRGDTHPRNSKVTKDK